MPEYSIEEYADMYFAYGELSGNANAAVRRYAYVMANGGYFKHLFFFFTIPPPPGGTAILPEYIHYYGYYYQVIVQCLST
jgi:hypothetical protein